MILIISEKGMTIKLPNHNAYANEKLRDKLTGSCGNSFSLGGHNLYVMRTSHIIPPGEVKMVLSKKRKSSKSKSDYKVITEKISQAQE